MVADFTWSWRACSGVFVLWSSCRGLAVLGSCFLGVHHPLGAGAAIWGTENLRGSSLGQPNSEGPSEIFSRPGQACCTFSGLHGVQPGAGSPMKLIRESLAPPEGLDS